MIEEKIQEMWARTRKLMETCLRGGDTCTIRISW